jgi:hypothetical protein
MTAAPDRRPDREAAIIEVHRVETDFNDALARSELAPVGLASRRRSSTSDRGK